MLYLIVARVNEVQLKRERERESYGEQFKHELIHFLDWVLQNHNPKQEGAIHSFIHYWQHSRGGETRPCRRALNFLNLAQKSIHTSFC